MLLTGPAHALTDFQAEYGGFLMGPGTAYGLPPGIDWLDLPGLKTMDQARDWADGSWSGPDFVDVRTLTASVEISPIPGTTFQAATAAFVNAITAADADLPFWMKLPGFPILGLGAKVAKRSLPIDIGFELGTLAVAAAQWRAVNPAWQSVPRSNTLTLTSGTGSGGLSYPLHGTGPLDYGITTAASYAAAITNAGNVRAPLLVAVTGPTSGFTITVDGHVVTYSGTITAADIVTVDWSTGRAYLSSAGSAPADRTYLLTSRDFAFVPPGGTATVAYAGTGGSAQVITADFWR